MKLKKVLFSLFAGVFLSSITFADTVSITHFVIKENPFANNEIAIVATDTANNIREDINGTYNFTVNGFDDQLKFDKGTAFYRHKLERSSFLYIKHINNTNSPSILYYAYKQDSKIVPIHISWILLLAIPVILVVLAYIFKRFMIIALILFCIFLYFNHSNGLGISTFFESIFDGIKHLFSKV
jgi:hypothetical protein